jgi:hypothetical protein
MYGKRQKGRNKRTVKRIRARRGGEAGTGEGKGNGRKGKGCRGGPLRMTKRTTELPKTEKRQRH